MDTLRKRPARGKSKPVKKRRANTKSGDNTGTATTTPVTAPKKRRVSPRRVTRKPVYTENSETEVEAEKSKSTLKDSEAEADNHSETHEEARVARHSPRQIITNFAPGDTVTGQWKGPDHKGEWYPGWESEEHRFRS